MSSRYSTTYGDYEQTRHHRDGRPSGRRTEDVLPRGVTSQLQRLQQSLTNTHRDLLATASSANTSTEQRTASSHNTSSSTHTGHRGHGSSAAGYRHGAASIGSSEDYRIAARRVLQQQPRRDRYEVESVSDDVVSRGADHIKGRDYNAPPLSPRRRLNEHGAVTDRQSYYGASSLGQRWGSAFADMEDTLLAKPALPQHPRHLDDAEEDLTATRAPLSGNTRSEGNQQQQQQQQPPRRFYDDPAVSEEQQVVSSTLERLEIDALKRQSGELASLKIELKNTIAGHNVELQQLKVEHQRQVEKITEDFREAKMRLLDESHQRSHIAFSAKEELYKAEIDTIQLRAKESEMALETERLRHGATSSELRTSMEQCETIRREIDQYRTDLERLSSEYTTMRRERTDIQQAFQDRDVELRACRHREQLLTDEKHALQSRIRHLEEDQRLQDLTTKDQMRKLEKEFTETNVQFEMLLNEASETKQKYERSKSKYKTMKDAAIHKERELESALQHATILNKDMTSELESYQEQLRDAQATISRKEYETRTERSSHESVLQDIHRDREKSDAAYRERLNAKDREVADLENHVARLQAERNDVGQRVRRIESDLDAQREATLILQDDLARQKGQHEAEIAGLLERHADAITALKRKLAEKDRQIEQLIPTANESVQKIRKQLEDERSKRAALEQQIEHFRRLAKTAEENYRKELHKEQRRHPLYLNASAPAAPAPSSGHAPQYQQSVGDAPHQPPRAEQTVLSIVQESPRRHVPQSEHADSHHQSFEPHYPLPPSSSMAPLPQSNNINNNKQRSVTPPQRRVVTPPLTSSSQAEVLLTGDMEDAVVQHERVLDSHRAVANEIYQRIMGGQDTFWEQCSDVLRRGAHTANGSGQLRIASVVAARARHTGAAASSNDADGTEVAAAGSEDSD